MSFLRVIRRLKDAFSPSIFGIFGVCEFSVFSVSTS
jgi:hypothetical protein